MRKRAPPRGLIWCFAAMTFSGWEATLAGWIDTEIGRQPWLVTGILRTSDAAGRVGEAALGASLSAFGLVYGVMLLAYIVTLTHMAGKGAAP
jgi:cytochrome d ubiquinol oxidase subunit I